MKSNRRGYPSHSVASVGQLRSNRKGIIITLFSNMVVDGRGSSPLRPDGFIPGERASGIHCKAPEPNWTE